MNKQLNPCMAGSILICATLATLTGCEMFSAIIVAAEQDARDLTNKIDREIYLSLSERHTVYELIRSGLQYKYTNDCKLR